MLVHGLIGHLRYTAGELASRGIVALAPDLVGYGELGAVTPARVSLAGQVAELETCVRSAFGATPVDVVGHSVGGVIGALYAARHPSRVRRFVSVEGNFSLDDAFWTRALARQSLSEVDATFAALAAEPHGWLTRSGITPSLETLAVAREWLTFQPGSTLHAMARSVVSVTGDASYEPLLRAVLTAHPSHLIAGERSRGGWHVPAWALSELAPLHVLADAGHLMMLEAPAAFADLLAQILAEP